MSKKIKCQEKKKNLIKCNIKPTKYKKREDKYKKYQKNTNSLIE